MASVTFPVSLGGNGLTYNDTDMLNGGHVARFITLLAQEVVMAQAAADKAEAAALSLTNATNQALSALTYANNASNSAVASASSASSSSNSAAAAQGYASLAQATTPDTPMLLNQRQVIADFTISSGYNAVSAGPIEISENIIVTINQDATWSIV